MATCGTGTYVVDPSSGLAGFYAAKIEQLRGSVDDFVSSQYSKLITAAEADFDAGVSQERYAFTWPSEPPFSEPNNPSGLDQGSVSYTSPADADTTGYDGEMPAASYDEAPTFSEAESEFDQYPAPSERTITAPSSRSLDDIEFATYAGFTLPTAPTLDDVTIDAAPTLTIPSFTAQLQDVAISEPEANYTYDSTDYSSTLLTALQSTLDDWLTDGSVGFPDAIWEALQFVATTRIFQVNARATSEATRDWTSRGWDDIDYVLEWRKLEAQQRNQNAANRHAREVAILDEELQLQTLKAAIAQGVVLEQVLINKWNLAAQRLLAAARIAVEVAVILMRARVARFNARVQQYSARAQAWRIQIEANLEQLTAARAQIEGQKTLGRLDLQVVETYGAGVSAAKKEIEAYRSYVRGMQSVSDTNQAVVDQFAADVDAFEAEIRSYAEDWNVYGAKSDAEGAKWDFVDRLTQAFGSRIRAHATEVGGETAKVRTDAAIHGLESEQVRMSGDIFSSKVVDDIARMDTLATQYSLDLEKLQTENAWTRSMNRIEQAIGRVKVSDDQAAATEQMQRARLRAGELGTAAQAAQVMLGSVSQSLSQVDAAAFQAMNFSARSGLTLSESNSRSCKWSIEGNTS